MQPLITPCNVLLHVYLSFYPVFHSQNSKDIQSVKKEN